MLKLAWVHDIKFLGFLNFNKTYYSFIHAYYTFERIVICKAINLNVNKIFKRSVSIASAVQFKNKRITFILLEWDYVSRPWQEPCMVQEFTKKIVFSKVWEHFKGASKASWGI